MTNLILQSKIPSKKNSYRLSKAGGMYKPAKITEFEELVQMEVLVQKTQSVPGTFSLEGKFYLSKTADLDNATTTLLDCLEKAGVIENDKLLVHLDVWKIVQPKRFGCEVTLTAV